MKAYLEMPKPQLMEFSGNSRRHAEERFDLARQLEGHLKVYDRVLSGQDL
jgi:hypothetical protein